MDIPHDTEEARSIQLRLRKKIKIVPLIKKPEFIAGVDAACTEDRIIAAACLYKLPELIPVEDAYAVLRTSFPYIPGLLSFREGPAVIKAIGRLNNRPDIILFDGQGIAHPAGMGIAAHIGVLLGIPSIGCAKSRLVGDYTGPGSRKGQKAELIYRGTIIGEVLRTRDRVKPLFISPGHLIDLNNAVEVVLTCIGKYRLPEPIRRAHALAGRLKTTLPC